MRLCLWFMLLHELWKHVNAGWPSNISVTVQDLVKDELRIFSPVSIHHYHLCAIQFKYNL